MKVNGISESYESTLSDILKIIQNFLRFYFEQLFLLVWKFNGIKFCKCMHRKYKFVDEHFLAFQTIFKMVKDNYIPPKLIKVWYCQSIWASY